MDVKKSAPSRQQTVEGNSKEKKTPTTGRFKSLMEKRRTQPKRDVQEKTVFDLASSGASRDQMASEQGLNQSSLAVEDASLSSCAGMDPLSPDMAALVDKMVHFIKLESQKGVDTTTVMIDIEGSVFNGSEIIIDHYDTAPHSFNLRLSGQTEAVDLFNANLASLQTSLQTCPALAKFQIHVLPPILCDKFDLDLHLRGKEKPKKVLGKAPIEKKSLPNLR